MQTAKYKLLISYEGTQYSGWQIQPSQNSIQSLIEKALSTALRQKTPVTGAGRTDSGVHALEQVAHFIGNKDIDLKKLHHSLNGLLPLDIRILSIFPVDDHFHARFSARSKIYRYHIDLGKTVSPFRRPFTYHFPHPFDREKLKKALEFFIGKHDFTSFSNESHKGGVSKNPIRKITRIDLIENGEELCLEFEGNGFLYKMVRNIVGTLVDIARGKIPLETLSEIFAAKDRSKGGQCAPPQGLFLVKVVYDEDFSPASTDSQQ